MAVPNVAQVWGLTPKLTWTTSPMTAANTTRDGTTGTTYSLNFTGLSPDVGSLLGVITFQSLGTNVATVCRMWLNNGSSAGTAANNVLYDEFTLDATTAIETEEIPLVSYTFNLPIPAGYTIFFTLGTAVSAGWKATAGQSWDY
jgi:hypothetical protein